MCSVVSCHSCCCAYVCRRSICWAIVCFSACRSVETRAYATTVTTNGLPFSGAADTQQEPNRTLPAPLGVCSPHPPAAGPQRQFGAPPGHRFRSTQQKPGQLPVSCDASARVGSEAQPYPAAQAAMVSCDDAISSGLLLQTWCQCAGGNLAYASTSASAPSSITARRP